MTTQTENTSPIKISPADVNKIVRACLKKTWPKWSAKQYSIAQDKHGNYNSSLTWQDHADRQTMIELLKPFSAKSGLMAPPTTFEWDGKSYRSYTAISYKRVYTTPFLTRIATIFCRCHQLPLPEIIDDPKGARIRAEQNEPSVGEMPLSKAIIEFAHTIHADDLERLEQESDALYPPLPQPSPEQLEQRSEAEEQRRRALCLRLEQQRQKYQFRAAVYQQLPDKEALYAETQHNAYELSKLIRKQAPDHYEPVFCVGCRTYKEQPDCTVIERPYFAITMYLCQACVNAETYVPYPLPENVLKEEAQLQELEGEEIDDSFQPVLDPETGFYLGKNGEAMPILTRDLLHDVRVSKWWLWFGEDTSGKKVPSQEVRGALRKAGWRWGYRRKQYHTSNQFGVLNIPEIVYQQYGGYIDGGFCDYRSTRGTRLRAYADRIEDKADQMEDWSNAIVAKYMATGSIVTGGWRTRKLQKEKARAEKKAEETRRLDAYAHDLRRRANSSEAYQQYLASDDMLSRRLDTLRTDLRSYEKGFDDIVTHTTDGLHYRQSISQHSVRWLVHRYNTYYQPRMDIIQEEMALINTAIEARSAGLQSEPEIPEPIPVPTPKERSFDVGGVIEVNVGADNRTDLFPTDKKITRWILEKYPIPWDSTVLEPHGGTGAMLSVVYEHLVGSTVPIYTYELLWDLNQYLQQQGYTVLGSDYLESTLPDEIEQAGGYGDMCINPPFNSWEKHVAKAWTQLRPGGRMRVILPANAFHVSPMLVRLSTEAEVFEQTDLPEDAFKVSGTMVRTMLVYLVKPTLEETIVPAAPIVEAPENLPTEKKQSQEGSSELQQENATPSAGSSQVVIPLQEASSLAISSIGSLSTFGIQVSGAEVQVTQFEELWRGMKGRKIICDLRKIPPAKKAPNLPAPWQPATLRSTYGMGYVHFTKFKHEARIVRPEGQARIVQSNLVWEVSLWEGPIEELVTMLKLGYSLLLLDRGASFHGSLRQAIVEALQKKLPGLAIRALR